MNLQAEVTRLEGELAQAKRLLSDLRTQLEDEKARNKRAATHIEYFEEEAGRLRGYAVYAVGSLERARSCIKGLLARTPVRDVSETLAEIDHAISQWQGADSPYGQSFASGDPISAHQPNKAGTTVAPGYAPEQTPIAQSAPATTASIPTGTKRHANGCDAAQGAPCICDGTRVPLESPEIGVQPKPVLWLRMKDGEPDMDEQCVAEFREDLICGDEDEGYTAIPLYAHPPLECHQRGEEVAHPDTARLDWLQDNYFLDDSKDGSTAWRFYTPKEEDTTWAPLRDRLDAAIKRHADDDERILERPRT
jgi:hypothetical protein